MDCGEVERVELSELGRGEWSRVERGGLEWTGV